MVKLFDGKYFYVVNVADDLYLFLLNHRLILGYFSYD